MLDAVTSFLLASHGFWPALALGLVTSLVMVYQMNKGRKWFVNILAQKEPALVGAGVFLWILLPGLWSLVGVVPAAIGFVSRYTELFSI